MRQVACIVADARHPLVYAPAALYNRLRAIRPVPPEIVICLTKSDLVSVEHLTAWTTQLQRRYPESRVVPFSSKGKAVGENARSVPHTSQRGGERPASRQR